VDGEHRDDKQGEAGRQPADYPQKAASEDWPDDRAQMDLYVPELELKPSARADRDCAEKTHLLPKKFTMAHMYQSYGNHRNNSIEPTAERQFCNPHERVLREILQANELRNPARNRKRFGVNECFIKKTISGET
jgi:hypothetical protein